MDNFCFNARNKNDKLKTHRDISNQFFNLHRKHIKSRNKSKLSAVYLMSNFMKFKGKLLRVLGLVEEHSEYRIF